MRVAQRIVSPVVFRNCGGPLRYRPENYSPSDLSANSSRRPPHFGPFSMAEKAKRDRSPWSTGLLNRGDSSGWSALDQVGEHAAPLRLRLIEVQARHSAREVYGYRNVPLAVS